MFKEIAKYGLGLFVALLLLPGLLKTAHIFASHQHIFCDHYAENHIHQASVDCDIFHFQQSTFPSAELFALNLFVPEDCFSSPIAFYPERATRFSDKVSTRGPPSV